jgi:putative oxygen-independent coproporphyrinogen III oxidase
MPLGLYISVPFCRTKCSYCNFASDVFSSSIFQRYIDRVCADITRSAEIAEEMGALFDRAIDSVYLGGGTPTVLDIAELERLFVTISQNFDVQPGSEITVECAPGTLTPALLDLLPRCGVNRVSLGAQSFVDQETRSVGRLHNRTIVIDDIAHLRAAGIENINIDLIAGLPHQTVESWNLSLSHVIDSGVPHVSVYMLEVDEDSRLGRELIAGGTRYHAHFVPDDDVTADLYEITCERLDNADVRQYEISNFARKGHESRHNRKYWTRQPYLGFGVDAHSMLPAKPLTEAESCKPEGEIRVPARALRGNSGTVCEDSREAAQDCSPRRESRVRKGKRPSPSGAPEQSKSKDAKRTGITLCSPAEAIRVAAPESLDAFLSRAPMRRTLIPPTSALEECFFLGLRLNRGVDLSRLAASFGEEAVKAFSPAIAECIEQNLLERDDEKIRLTSRGRLLSNEVFARFLTPTECIG